ncbi:MAG: esterase-like activity of phytase family protein [Hamadaea sp.]|uniref:esterase-like activity of phytase family protein n=1 Tax=Hamadaea sp. TaxID=2024425 RepID=UPI0018360841|nr:esterase-like activity of phytase family protein [Hamadaea sp.]NUR71914.1 esterase-like activity of phytase family protein [Hamadaea sp.]NUT18217.1 esterase-like activity of phytase family protein [Hamadaea sp.]
MTSRRRAAALAVPTVAALVATAAPAAANDCPPDGPRVVQQATLPPIALGAFSNSLLPGSVADDRGVNLGGIGSDIFPAGRPNEFWTVTDRGPNGQIKIGKEKRRTFPVAGFDPAIVKIRLRGDVIEVLDAIPITTASGQPVTGLSNQATRDEQPYTYDAATPLGFNPNGLDTEGIVRAHDGTFWLADEYGPSLVHVSAQGRVLARYVPQGLGLTGADYPVVEALPAIYLTRKTNRGFEGLALLPDGDLVLALQSPLLNPDKKTGEASRTTRLLRFSPRKAQVISEYAYRFDPVSIVDPGQTDPAELKISSIVAVGPSTLLVEERTDNAARLHRVRLPKGEGILGGQWDDLSTTPSLEAADDDAYALPKELVIDLNTIAEAPKKIEGIAVVDPHTIVVINDNDFGMSDGTGAFDANGRLIDSGILTRVVVIRLNGVLE